MLQRKKLNTRERVEFILEDDVVYSTLIYKFNFAAVA
jgi:hypothetical protein